MRITTKSDTLIVLLEGMERLWALKASLCVSAADTTSVEWNPGLPERQTVLRLKMPGSAIPGIFYAGSFWQKSGWQFCYLKSREEGELIVTTKNTHYRKIRLTTDEATAFEVREWFRQHGTSAK